MCLMRESGMLDISSDFLVTVLSTYDVDPIFCWWMHIILTYSLGQFFFFFMTASPACHLWSKMWVLWSGKHTGALQWSKKRMWNRWLMSFLLFLGVCLPVSADTKNLLIWLDRTALLSSDNIQTFVSFFSSQSKVPVVRSLFKKRNLHWVFHSCEGYCQILKVGVLLPPTATGKTCFLTNSDTTCRKKYVLFSRK